MPCFTDSVSFRRQSALLTLTISDIRQRALAERQESILTQWTDQLESRTQTWMSTQPMQDWSTWMFAESVRRTILFSHLVRCLHRSLKLGYACPDAGTLASKMFTAQTELWDLSPGHTLPAIDLFEPPPVVSYHNFLQMWEQRHLKGLDSLERILLVVCKGEQCTDMVTGEPRFLPSNAGWEHSLSSMV